MEEREKTIANLGGSDEIRARLQTQRAEILALYENDVRAGQEASDEGTEDIVDRANNAYSRELLFSLSDGERNTLLRIEEAIRRVENGSYGVCANCNRVVKEGRLKAVPWARYCIDCQELVEKGVLDEV